MNKIRNFLTRIKRKNYKFSSIMNFIIISSIIISIIYSIFFGVEISRLNNIATKKRGEINEIENYRENLKEIDIEYTNLLLDVYEKDFEIYQAIENMDMTEYEAITILEIYAHRTKQLFKDFIMSSTSKYYIYVDFDILDTFQDKFLQSINTDQPIYERTWNLVNFEILISEDDNKTDYLYKKSPWGEFNLNNFLVNKSQFGTSNLVHLINETEALNTFWYDKTWEILYNYSYFGVLNINVDLQLYDRIVLQYYEKPFYDLQNKKMDYEIGLVWLSSLVLLFTLFLDIFGRIRSSKKINKNYKLN